MNLAVLGADGQLGAACVRAAAGRGHVVGAFTRDALDVTELDAVRARLAGDAVIDCAAYTAVDAAEVDRDRAFAVNATGAGHVAQLCAARQIPMIYVSTDYVFDGAARRPYLEDDPVAPLGIYGASKAAGEAAVHAAGGLVVRTSWLFSRDRPCFVRTIARAAIERASLRVVDDQRGCPTYADDLAAVLVQLAERALAGAALAPTYHACNPGPITWCELARAVVELARTHRPLACTEVTPIATAEYPTAARRPAYSVLDTSRLGALGLALPPWRAGLAEAVAAICRD